VNAAGLTPKQRLTVLLMIVAVIIVFAMLAGFVATSLQGIENAPPATPLPLALSSPVPLPPPPPTPYPISEEGIWSQVQAARIFDQIAHQVETARGLSPRAEIPLSFLDEREMTTLLRLVYTERALEAQLLPYVALGLLPDGRILARAHQAAGAYVPEQEQLYVATGQSADSDDQAVLAHAHAHALQDQHFDLGAMDARATTTDSALAVEALIEGDALLLTAFYRYGDPAAADWDHLTELILQAEQPDYGGELDGNVAWEQLEQFPYREGRWFAAALFQAGGWQALNRAYTAPPRSTEQVLHPERYLEKPDSPPRVTVPDLGGALGAGWELRLRDTLGEFVIGLYLNTLLSEESARQAADGWSGDTFVTWEHEQDGQACVWRTIWDSTAEAEEFERALVATIPHRYALARPLEPPDDPQAQWWETESNAVYVSRVARYVTFVELPNADLLADVVEILP